MKLYNLTMRFDLKKINPIVKILSSMALAFTQTISNNLCSRLFLLLIILIVSFFTKSKFKLKLKSVMMSLVFSFLSSLIFTSSNSSDVIIDLAFISVSKKVIQNFISMSVSFVTFWMISMVLLNSISSNEISYIISFFLKPFERFNINVSEISMITTLAIRFMPVIIDETKKIIIAQESRGALISRGSIFKRIRYIIPIFNPIFASCFRRAINVSIAMESRCYGAPFKKTSLYENNFKKIDIIVILIVISISCGVIWCNSIKIF